MGQFTLYRSTDAGAPVLYGQIGSLIGLLDACLVNGYGSKAAAGWTKPFTGTNTAVYRMGGGAQFFLRVEDGTTIFASVHGYVSMTDADTGITRFPNQTASYCHKSATADTTARPWVLFADNRTLYLFVLTGNSSASYVYTPFAFGEFDSFVAGDAYNVFISPASSSLSDSKFGNALLGNCGYVLSDYWWAAADCHVPGSVPQVEGATYLNLALASGLGQRYTSGARRPSSGHVAYPNGADGGLYVSRKLLLEYAGANSGAYNCTFHVRGALRGLWVPLHLWASIPDGSTWSGSGSESGKTFEVVRAIHCTGDTPTFNSSYTLGSLALETSNTLS